LFGGVDGSAWVCDAATGSVQGHTPALGTAINVVTFSPDGKTFLTTMVNGEVRFWDAATLTSLGKPMPVDSWVTCAQFSADGRWIFVGCEDGTARLWDIRTAKLVMQPLVHKLSVYGLAFHPDGQTIVTGDDRLARAWDIATGQPIGPILWHHTGASITAFLADGKYLFVGEFGPARIFPVPPALPDELERVALWVEAITGLSFDKELGHIQTLDNASWLERRELLMQLGGPPETEAEERVDPILFGLDPTARARHFMERKHWDAAEAALREASRARPLNIPIQLERAAFYIVRRRPEKAAAEIREAIRLRPEYYRYHHNLALSLQVLGDLDGLRQLRSDLLCQFGTTTDPGVANNVAWFCLLGADAVGDRTVLVQLAELAVNGASEEDKHLFLNTLGAALYLAGRLEEAIRRLEEGIRKRGGESVPQDWVFLALAHHQLRHRAEARRWLERLRGHHPDEGPNAFWNELEIRLLRREAETVIDLDPIFPSDPFAR
jgi:tetratricopeptide (TPR) repeat protein